jgi:hypothetical protein
VACSPGEFYLAEPRSLLSQGDIYLAPAVVAWSAASRSAIPLIPPAPAEPGHTVYAPAWRAVGASAAPAVTLATSWTPVLVISHDCEIDKEFNEYVDALIREGIPAEQAEVRASAIPELDRYVLVSPLLPYHEEELAAERWSAVRAGQKIGYFPLPQMPAYENDEFFVHLSRIATVERRLLSPEYKAASLTELGRGLLRFKLAEVLSSRNLSVVSRLEQAIGQRISEVRTLKVKRQEATVALVLEDGSELQVGARADREAPVPERTRHTEQG